MPPVLKTLERVLSKAGLGSRTEARRWIAQGRVAVDGRKTLSPDEWVDAAKQRITFDGKPLRAAEPRTILLYKPKGYITTYKDPQGRPTIYSLLGGLKEKVFSAGRLDLDTSGLLILTNNGDLLERLTNPDYHVPKTYLVKASKLLSDADLDRLRQGIELDDGPTRPAKVTRLRDSERYTHFEITLTEGRNRQVRRMVEALGAVVLKLVRTRIGTLTIGDLPIGTWRELTLEELRTISARGNLSGRKEPVNLKVER
jgi:23S rRNA pseudouridine2605 synthase